jgi:hypothetical protein
MKLSMNYDYNLFQNNYENNELFDLGSKVNNCLEGDIGDIIQGNFKIMIDHQKQMYFVIYMKFQDLLNNVNSVVTLLGLILSFIGRTYNSAHLSDEIIKKSFIFKKKAKDKQQPQLEIEMNNVKEKLKKTENTNNAGEQISNISSDVGNQLQKRGSENYHIKFRSIVKTEKFVVSFPDFLFRQCSKKLSEDVNLFKMAESKYFQIIDILQVLLKLNQIEVLSRMNLTNHQWVLINKMRFSSSLNEDVEENNDEYFKMIDHFREVFIKGELCLNDYLLLKQSTQTVIEQFKEVMI